jgi:hypothetical protein
VTAESGSGKTPRARGERLSSGPEIGGGRTAPINYTGIAEGARQVCLFEHTRNGDNDQGVTGRRDSACVKGDTLPSSQTQPWAVCFIAAVWPDVANPDELVERLRRACPRVNVDEEIRRAHAWEEAQAPSRRKKRHARFLTNWILRARPTLPTSAPARRVFLRMEGGRPVYADE